MFSVRPPLAGFDCRSSQYDALHQLTLDCVNGRSYRQIRFSGAGRPGAKSDVVFLNMLEVFDLARRAAVKLRLARHQRRRQAAAERITARRAIDQLDQSKLDLVDRKRVLGQCVKPLQGFGSARCLYRFAAQCETFAAASDGNIERGFDLAQIFVERATQIGEVCIVDG